MTHDTRHSYALVSKVAQSGDSLVSFDHSDAMLTWSGYEPHTQCVVLRGCLEKSGLYCSLGLCLFDCLCSQKPRKKGLEGVVDSLEGSRWGSS